MATLTSVIEEYKKQTGEDPTTSMLALYAVLVVIANAAKVAVHTMFVVYILRWMGVI